MMGVNTINWRIETASKNKEQTLRKIVESKFFHRVCSCETFHEELLLRLMSILSKSLLTLVRGHLVTFSFFTAWHFILSLKN